MTFAGAVGWWEGDVWKASTGASYLPSAPVSARPNATVWVLGDSTMRFFYAALLAAFQVPHESPLHRLPNADPCSFRRVGWTSSGKCARRWRGPCGEHSRRECTLEYNASGTRLMFSWWRPGMELIPPVRATDLLVTSCGVWEAMNEKERYEGNVRSHIEHLTSAVPAKHTIILSNGACLAMQRRFFSRYHNAFWPSAAFEETVLRGNEVLRHYAYTRPHTSFIDRAPSMLTGNDTVSPCFHHHAHGKASELHVRWALVHLVR